MNAHHQNGIAEGHIHTITECARTMLIHAMLSWPDIIQEQLWPYAICLQLIYTIVLLGLLASLQKRSHWYQRLSLTT